MMENFKDRDRNIELDFSKIDINPQDLKSVGENRSTRLGYNDRSVSRSNVVRRENNYRKQLYNEDQLYLKKRGESRNMQRLESAYHTPLRTGDSSIRPSVSTVKKPAEQRIMGFVTPERNAHGEQKQPPKFSFMKETASSLQRKVNTPVSQPVSFDARRNKAAMATKKRQDQLKSLPTSVSKRKLLEAASINAHPFDITNLQYYQPEKLTSSPKQLTMNYNKTIESPSPSVENYRINPANEEVRAYNRLYNSAKLKTKENQSSMAAESKKSQGSFKTVPISKKQRSSVEPRNTKVDSFHAFYSYIYNKDKTLFDEESTNEYQLCKPYDLGDLGQEETLNVFERGEILHKQDIYYISRELNKSVNIRDFKRNFGFDDQDSNYIIAEHDHINYRYEIEHILGNGSFGNVIKCKDHKFMDKQDRHKPVAVKIIKNDVNWSCQAVYEIKMLRHLNDNNPEHSSILKYLDHFHFRGHMCIVTELLSLNLYSMLELLDFKGISSDLTKYFCKRILHGLQFIHDLNIIHCDIKPENIMIKLPTDFNPNSDLRCSDLIVKIIDFGSSCFDNEKSYTYIQSRFYRAPEVILGANYESKIDIWSFGCVIAELFSGLPLLPGKGEVEQIGLILELFGAPKSSLIMGMRRRLQSSLKASPSKISTKTTLDFDPTKANDKIIRKTLLYNLFDLHGKVNMNFLNQRVMSMQNYTRKQFKLNSKNVGVVLKLQQQTETPATSKAFLNFLMRIFNWDPQERSTVHELLNDEFLTQ